MSKEEFLKIQTCVLKVNIHCDGCKHKVKKILQQIEGVYTTNVDSEQGKVTVSGNVDPDTLIKKLLKKGKHAEIWGAPKPNPNQNQNQMKNLQLDNDKGGNNKGKGPGQVPGQNPGPTQKGGAKGGQQGPSPTQPQQLQQQYNGMKLPQMKNLKMPFTKNQSEKGVKFNMPEPEDLSDDDFDEDDDDFDDEDDYDDDDEFDDDMDDAPLPPNKMKPMVVNGNGGGQMGGMMMKGGQLPQMKVTPGGGIGDVNGKKGGANGSGNIPVHMGGGGNIPVQMGGGANGGKKGGGANQNQGGGGGPAKNGGGKNGGPPSDGKNGNNGNGGGKKGGGGMNDGFPMMPNMMGMRGVGGGVASGSHGANLGQMGNMPMGPVSNLPMGPMANLPMGHMGNIPAVQGLPATATGGGGGGASGGYFQGAGPEIMGGNPHYQQQMAAMMMNQQRANGNEGFHPMMYARQPPAVNYMPPYQPYPPPAHDPYSDYVSDENTSSCNIM